MSITLSNEGSATHTFTSDGLNIDKDVSAGKKVKFTVTVPSDGTAFAVPLRLPPEHGDAGRVLHQGGWYRAVTEVPAPYGRRKPCPKKPPFGRAWAW